MLVLSLGGPCRLLVVHTSLTNASHMPNRLARPRRPHMLPTCESSLGRTYFSSIFLMAFSVACHNFCLFYLPSVVLLEKIQTARKREGEREGIRLCSVFVESHSCGHFIQLASLCGMCEIASIICRCQILDV